MKSVVVVGAQWGDEGKGKVVDYLSGSFDYIARVVASGNACNVVERAGQIVYDLALALITPLRAYHHNGFHSFSLFSRFPGSPGTTALTRPHPSLSAMP